MYPIHISSMLPMYIVQSHTIIKQFLFLVSEMAETVPLAGGLGVECPDVVVYGSRWFLIYIFMEELAAEEGCFLGIEGPVQRDSF
jgi:hypothetical protein